jgi:hypothetical protein
MGTAAQKGIVAKKDERTKTLPEEADVLRQFRTKYKQPQLDSTASLSESAVRKQVLAEAVSAMEAAGWTGWDRTRIRKHFNNHRSKSADCEPEGGGVSEAPASEKNVTPSATIDTKPDPIPPPENEECEWLWVEFFDSEDGTPLF